jgi:hypothetical protein
VYDRVGLRIDEPPSHELLFSRSPDKLDRIKPQADYCYSIGPCYDGQTQRLFVITKPSVTNGLAPNLGDKGGKPVKKWAESTAWDERK